MRIQPPLLPQSGTADYDAQLNRALTDYFRLIEQQVNQLTEGQIAAVTNAATAIPTAAAQVGDFIRNSNPTEAGSVSSKYVIIGWVYTATGWKECRCLTGN